MEDVSKGHMLGCIIYLSEGVVSLLIDVASALQLAMEADALGRIRLQLVVVVKAPMFLLIQNLHRLLWRLEATLGTT